MNTVQLGGGGGARRSHAPAWRTQHQRMQIAQRQIRQQQSRQPRRYLAPPPSPPACRGQQSWQLPAAAGDQAEPAAAQDVQQQQQQQQQPQPGSVVESQVGQAAAASAAGPASEQQGAAAPQRQRRWRAMLLRCWHLLRLNLWPLVVAHGVTDAIVFVLHRLSHRATNEVAVRVLGGGMLTPAALGNMWWLSVDPAIANFQTGYQILTFVFFLVAFPLNVAIKTWASAATILLCQRTTQQEQEQQPAAEEPHSASTAQLQTQQAQQLATPADTPQQEGQAAEQPAKPADAAGPAGGEHPQWWQLRRGLRHAFSSLASISKQAASIWRPVFLAELLVAVVVVPAQFASLAVITLPLTLPIILEFQAAGPVAALEGLSGVAAMKRSRQLLRPLRWQLAVPFVGLVVAGRLLEGAKATMLNAMPARFYRELVELPLVVLVGGSILSILIARLQDVLPFVAFAEATSAGGAAAASSDDGAGGKERGSGQAEQSRTVVEGSGGQS